MSPLGIAGTAFSLLSALGGASSSRSGDTDFASALNLRLASQRSQSFDALLGSLSGKGEGAAGLFGGTAGDVLSMLGGTGKDGGLSLAGRNLSLFDPESAYRMMTDINGRDATYKAQFAELSEMRSALAGMRQAGETLAAGVADPAADEAAVLAGINSFVDAYNAWVERFAGTVQSGGLLAGTQAAEVSLRALRQSIGDSFNGAAGGVRGMSAIGLTVDPATQRASLDVGRLQSALAGNRNGVVAAVGEFGRHFARSAELLVSENNFIPNRLDNLDRAIDFIADNRTSLQAEFGLGDPARPSPLVAKALAAYERMLKA
jgi:hypothetical protein